MSSAPQESLRSAARLPALDGLRGIAVLMVVFDHGGFGAGRPVGGAGVAVFFVISGFLITTLIARDLTDGTWSYQRFLVTRFVRLYPALLLMVAVTGAAATLTGAGRGLVVEVPGAVLYAQDFIYPFTRGSIYDHTWSLAVEEQFYLVWPFLLPLVLRRRSAAMWILMTAVACSVAARLLLTAGGHADAAYANLVTNAFALLLGCGIAVTRPTLPHRGPLGVAAAVVIGLAAAGPFLPVPFIDGPVIAALAAAVLLVAVVPGAPALENAPLRFIGRISYSLYLWHWPILLLTGTRWAGLGSLPAVVLAIGIATASTLLLEEPLRAAWRRTSRPAPAAALPQPEWVSGSS